MTKLAAVLFRLWKAGCAHKTERGELRVKTAPPPSPLDAHKAAVQSHYRHDKQQYARARYHDGPLVPCVRVMNFMQAAGLVNRAFARSGESIAAGKTQVTVSQLAVGCRYYLRSY